MLLSTVEERSCALSYKQMKLFPGQSSSYRAPHPTCEP